MLLLLQQTGSKRLPAGPTFIAPEFVRDSELHSPRNTQNTPATFQVAATFTNDFAGPVTNFQVLSGVPSLNQHESVA
jgi:hypothetical protein